MKAFHRPKILLLSGAFLLLIVWSTLGGRGLPPSEGIPNFGKVNNSLYRGAQPDEIGMKGLQSLNIKTIINLRTAKGALKTEESQARACGISYTNVPLAGLGKPSDAEVAKILALIESSPGPVFVHCEHGCDRTGTIIACYRIQHDHWSGRDAMREAKKYGISMWEHGMRRYIENFAKAADKPTAKSPAKK
jgi:protein tyrosine/serine phosphatase